MDDRARPPWSSNTQPSRGPVTRHMVELVQRGRIIMDLAQVRLDEGEASEGPFAPETWQRRQVMAEARRSWERLRAELGTRQLEHALQEPPVATLTIQATQGKGSAQFVLVGGKTYRLEAVEGTPSAPRQWRLVPIPAQKGGHYYVCRLATGETQCDCAHWTYRVHQVNGAQPCKHLQALGNLGLL